MTLEATLRADIAETIKSLDRAGLLAQTRPDSLPKGKTIVPYASSWRRYGGGVIFLVRTQRTKLLLTVDVNLPFLGEEISAGGHRIGAYPQSTENAAILRDLFPFTAPARLAAGFPSFGCGDRLGLANPGHIRVLRQYKVSPVLAQQSIRELNLTGRTYGQVVDAASWSVFQEDYEDGFGADGDHLKTGEEVKMVLSAGASMITLDLSLCLGATEGYGPCPGELLALAGRVFSMNGVEIKVDAEEIDSFWKMYWAAVDFVAEADSICRRQRGQGRYDLEVSVDETAHTTRPVDHLLLALELKRLGLQPFSIAPRFPGEFQKAIDYRGDLRQFEAEFRMHAAIAGHFGHKVSIHSGSDKFAIFPIAARLAGGNIHEKTAGTSWLEAVRVVAEKDPALFRRIYERARDFFPEAKKYYHIMTELEHVPPAEGLTDEDLPQLLGQEASRQFLHITYGQILQDPDLGPSLFKLLHTQEDAYYRTLAAHFLRHAQGLGLPRR